jgi:DNA-binding NarL/FixJ family response regulator
MVAIAIFSIDPMLRRSLEQLPRKDPAIAVVGIVDSPPALIGLAEKHHIDVVLAKEAPGRKPLAEWQIRHKQTAWMVFLDSADEQSSLDALGAGATAILPRSADLTEIVDAIRAVTQGLVVLHQKVLPALLSRDLLSAEHVNKGPDGHLRLTAREIEVLTAMADGASNKEIARRLGISFHTVKFHVAAILEKLGADTRTEAVIKAAQLAIVML